MTHLKIRNYSHSFRNHNQKRIYPRIPLLEVASFLSIQSEVTSFLIITEIIEFYKWKKCVFNKNMHIFYLVLSNTKYENVSLDPRVGLYYGK